MGSAPIFAFEELLSEITSDKGNYTMLSIDISPEQPHVAIVVAQKQPAIAKKSVSTMGVCHLINNLSGNTPYLPDGTISAENVFVPSLDAISYLTKYEHQKGLYVKREVEGVGVLNDISVTPATRILQQPKHGELIVETEVSRYAGEASPEVYSYIPEDGYYGKDRVVILADVNGKQIKIIYYFQVLDRPIGNTGYEDLCKKGHHWKISQLTSSEGTTVFSTDDNTVTVGSDYTISPSDFAGYDYLPPQITFAGLTGSAVGE